MTQIPAPKSIFRVEIREEHSNAVVCVGCEIHGDPGTYDIAIAKESLACHLRKHAEHIERVQAERKCGEKP